MLLEIFNGGSCYISFDSIKDVDKWREENKPFIGTLWSDDGYLIDEEELRNKECST